MGYLAPLMGLAAGLGVFSAYDWWWVALLATVGVIAGAWIGFEWFAPLFMVPYCGDLRCAGSLCGNATVSASSWGLQPLRVVLAVRNLGERRTPGRASTTP